MRINNIEYDCIVKHGIYPWIWSNLCCLIGISNQNIVLKYVPLFARCRLYFQEYIKHTTLIINRTQPFFWPSNITNNIYLFTNIFLFNNIYLITNITFYRELLSLVSFLLFYFLPLIFFRVSKRTADPSEVSVLLCPT